MKIIDFYPPLTAGFKISLYTDCFKPAMAIYHASLKQQQRNPNSRGLVVHGGHGPGSDTAVSPGPQLRSAAPQPPEEQPEPSLPPFSQCGSMSRHRLAELSPPAFSAQKQAGSKSCTSAGWIVGIHTSAGQCRITGSTHEQQAESLSALHISIPSREKTSERCASLLNMLSVSEILVGVTRRWAVKRGTIIV